ncbi:hypothetical protein IC617_02660 [Neiella sp. HB171785]|uniref:Uncharacterized protein n=1 Tax=Neiella litorisoli TaxID=2771431 RepID=A0A8J6QTW1_9GAMM|nr:hypothetical protein [Neiella litorisoli]MBD1388318.1 hypothetical protein [Neiella litorisoli]
MIRLLGLLVVSLLWLGVIASPVLVSSILGVAVFQMVEFSFGLVMLFFITPGILIGVLWAEKVRRGVGLIAFWGRLVGHPEIDGSR